VPVDVEGKNVYTWQNFKKQFTILPLDTKSHHCGSNHKKMVLDMKNALTKKKQSINKKIKSSSQIC